MFWVQNLGFWGLEFRIVDFGLLVPGLGAELSGGRVPLRGPSSLLEGSWDLVSKVIRITPLRGLITPIIIYLLSPMIL